MVAAINPRGPNGARVATVLFESASGSKKIDPMDLFSVDDFCDTIVKTNIPKVIYEYYAEDRNLISGPLTYPNVRADSTLPLSALLEVSEDIKQNKRNSSVIILTDGKSHQSGTTFNFVVNELKQLSDVLIAAGIGTNDDISVDSLAELSGDQSTVVYQPDTGKPLEFARSIVEKMKATAALCVGEGKVHADREVC